jgi:hypothetical protein
MFDTASLADTVSKKSNQELLAMLAKPEDWVPKALELARAELTRRGVTADQVVQHVAEKRVALAERAGQPLPTEQKGLTVLCAIVGLVGLVYVWPKAVQYETEGFHLNARMTWRAYWMTFGIIWAVLFGAAILGLILGFEP